MSEVESADSAPANQDEITDSSTDDIQETQAQEDQDVILTENTQKRFDQLTAEKRKLEESNAELMARLNKPDLNLNYQDPGAPKPDEFETDEDYIRASAKYEATKDVVNLFTQAQVEQEQAARQTKVQQKITLYNQKLSESQSKMPDFQQVTSSGYLQQADALGNPTPAAEAILEVENGPQAFYHIQSDPQLAMRLNNASPVEAAFLVKAVSDQFNDSRKDELAPPPPIDSEEQGAGLAGATDGKIYSQGATFE